MRRSTSALTTTIVGAVLAAATVSAQQFLPSASDRGGSSAVSASAPTSAQAPASSSMATSASPGVDPIIGMAATRGARYLLRNGLDYINYQEYERALKYLREAQTRQKELTEAEVLALKQAIERAQRGLREAVGGETPYALSRRSRKAGGFAPARPETQVADSSTASRPQTVQTRTRTINREGDDQGQPIRLAGAEVTGPLPNLAQLDNASRPTAASQPKPVSIASEHPAQLREIPKTPRRPSSTD